MGRRGGGRSATGRSKNREEKEEAIEVMERLILCDAIGDPGSFDDDVFNVLMKLTALDIFTVTKGFQQAYNNGRDREREKHGHG